MDGTTQYLRHFIRKLLKSYYVDSGCLYVKLGCVVGCVAPCLGRRPRGPTARGPAAQRPIYRGWQARIVATDSIPASVVPQVASSARLSHPRRHATATSTNNLNSNTGCVTNIPILKLSNRVQWHVLKMFILFILLTVYLITLCHGWCVRKNNCNEGFEIIRVR